MIFKYIYGQNLAKLQISSQFQPKTIDCAA